MSTTTTRGTTRGTSREIEGRDSVGLYLDEIARNPLLDTGRVGRRKGGAPMSATEAELEWLAEQGRQAVTEFINANLRLVVSIARKYGRSAMPMLGTIQEGNTGLIRAVEKFDYT